MCSLSLANKPEKRVFSLQVFRKYKKSKIDKTVRDERNLFPPSHCKPWAAPFQSSLQGLCPSVTEHLSRLLKISSAIRHTHYQQKTFTQASQQPCSSAWWWRDQRDTVKNCLLSQEAFTACTLQTEQYICIFSHGGGCLMSNLNKLTWNSNPPTTSSTLYMYIRWQFCSPLWVSGCI